MKTNSNYKYREIAGGYYLIPVRTAAKISLTPIQLTETAAWIWQQVNLCASVEELIRKMTLEYEVDQAHARKAVTQFLDELTRQGLIE